MTTQPQPEALRLADSLGHGQPTWATCDAAAAELRRLHAECEGLRMERDALRAAARHGGWAGYIDSDALRADAERGSYVVRNGGWIRSERDGCAYLTVRLPLAADLSCVATRRAAIDAARAAKEQSK